MKQTILKRINAGILNDIKTTASLPKYAPDEHSVGIVHIGIGAFHRGHQAVFTDQAIANSGGNWRIAGVSLRSPTVSQQLNPQDGLYTVIERSAGNTNAQIVGAIKEVVNAQQDQAKLIRYLSTPETKIITITVTEKGYHFDQSTQAINWQSKDVQNDVLHPNTPITMPGYVVLACLKRMQSEHSLTSKLTIISCDNLPENGKVTASVVLALAAKLSLSLVDWINQNVTFCSSMVDRIVPSVTENDIQQHAQKLGYSDQGLVITEPFKQWVIEDNFCTDRPDWESAGVLFVNNVSDYEKLKLRTLNGSHSALAYMGSLLGFTWIHEAIRDELLGKIVKHLMEQETGPTIPHFDGLDLSQYQQQIIDRFLNSDIAYGTQQVAMDGSQKLQQRILAPMTEWYLADHAENTRCLMATFVCWIRYLQQVTETGQDYVISDPYADVLTSIAADAKGDAKKLMEGLFTKTTVVPAALKCRTDFQQTLLAQLELQHKLGVEAYLKTVLEPKT